MNRPYRPDHLEYIYLRHQQRMNPQHTTIMVYFKTEHKPYCQEHLEQVALEWARSKGAEVLELEGKKVIVI